MARPFLPESAVTWLVGSEPKRVLVLGAAGPYATAIREQGHAVLVLDREPAALGRLIDHRPDLSGVVAQAEAMPFESQQFDRVVCPQNLHVRPGARPRGDRPCARARRATVRHLPDPRRLRTVGKTPCRSRTHVPAAGHDRRVRGGVGHHRRAVRLLPGGGNAHQPGLDPLFTRQPARHGARRDRGRRPRRRLGTSGIWRRRWERWPRRDRAASPNRSSSRTASSAGARPSTTPSCRSRCRRPTTPLHISLSAPTN